MSRFLAPQSRKVFQFDQMYYWAENGCIILHDEKDDSRRQISPKVWSERSAAIGLEAARCVYLEEQLRMQRIANEMMQCVQQAEAQGNPYREAVQDYHIRHQTGRKVQILVPGVNC